jgi:hypothetical protein
MRNCAFRVGAAAIALSPTAHVTGFVCTHRRSPQERLLVAIIKPFDIPKKVPAGLEGDARQPLARIAMAGI